MRIPLKVFSRVNPDGMIRLPSSDEEAARMGETFAGSDEDSERLPSIENRFRDDDDDDIPPPANGSMDPKKVKMTESEEDFFDVSDGEDEDEEQEPREGHRDEATNAWGR